MDINLTTIRHNITLKFKPGETPVVEIFLGLDRIGAIMVEDVFDAVIDCLLRCGDSTQVGIIRRKEEAQIILRHRLVVNEANLEAQNKAMKEEQEDDDKRISTDSGEEAGEVSGDIGEEEETILH